MWRGYPEALRAYMRAVLVEWQHVRGFKNAYPIVDIGNPELPQWLGNLEFHASHRSNLLRKDPVWYGQFGWVEDAGLPYVWPK